ncbi:MAG: hypothetical protein EOO04_29865 [Chitinophagaceae bacterium]|nr:MAG: hypothetical protein EOO04_29865 [Chitinophagaceae bacterium]
MSWGNRLLITFIIFGTGMIYLVYRSMHTEFELVEKDYYKTELAYQQVIDASKRSQGLVSRANIAVTDSVIQLQLPDEMKNKRISGSVWFYCAYNSAQDKKLPISINEDGLQNFPSGVLLPGSYTAKLSWEADMNHYYEELPIAVK